jgi:hypothetical protein
MKNQKPLKNGLVLIYFKEKTKADLAGIVRFLSGFWNERKRFSGCSFF